MTTLAAGSSVTVAVRDGGTVAIATNGGLASAVVSPTEGGSIPVSLGPLSERRTLGPYKEGASVVITNASCGAFDYDVETMFDPSSVAITGGTINGQSVVRPILSLLKRKAVSAQQYNPLDFASRAITVTQTTNAADVQLAVAFDLRTNQGAGLYRIGGGAAVGSSSLPVKSASILTTSNIGVVGAYQTGPYLEFMASAAATSVRVNCYVGGGAYASQFRIAVDGQYLASRGMTPFTSPTGVYNQLTIDLSAYDTSVPKRIRVEWDGFAIAASIGLNAGTIWQPYQADSLTGVIYGDSFVAYGSGRSPHTSAPAQAMQRMGLGYLLSGVGGTGYIATGGGNYALSDPTRIADLTLAGVPDFVVIAAGTNDVASTSSAVTAAALVTLRAIRAALPVAPIFVTGVWNGQAGSGIITMAQAETAVQAAFTAWADSNSFFIPICGATGGAWITASNSASFIADGTHPTAAGEWYLGQRLTAGIGAALANY